GPIVDLGTLGGEQSSAIAINNRGQVIGTSETADGQTHAFFWQHGRMTDLGTVGPWNVCFPYDINERAQVVGSCSANEETAHAVLWTPVQAGPRAPRKVNVVGKSVRAARRQLANAGWKPMDQAPADTGAPTTFLGGATTGSCAGSGTAS